MLCFRPKEEPVPVPVLRELTVVRKERKKQSVRDTDEQDGDRARAGSQKKHQTQLGMK